MASRGIDPLMLNSYRKKHRNIAVFLLIILGIVVTTYLGLAFSSSAYSLSTTISLISNLDQFRLSNGGYDPEVIKILATNIAIAALTALSIIILGIFSAKSLAKSKTKPTPTHVRRSSYHTPTPQPAPNVEPSQPVGLASHTNFNDLNPLPQALSSNVSQPATQTFAPQSPSNQLISANKPEEEDNQFRLTLPEGMNIPEDVRIPSNVALETQDNITSDLLAEPVLPPAPDTSSTGQTELRSRKTRFRSTHESNPPVKLPSQAKIIFIVISVAVIAGISSAVAIMATNRVSQETDGSYTQKFSENTLFSPSFMGDVSRGLLNPDIASLWLLALIVIILCVQAAAISTIANILLKMSRHRLTMPH